MKYIPGISIRRCFTSKSSTSIKCKYCNRKPKPFPPFLLHDDPSPAPPTPLLPNSMSSTPGPLRLKGSHPPSKISKKKKKPTTSTPTAPATSATTTTTADAAQSPSDQGPTTTTQTKEPANPPPINDAGDKDVAPPPLAEADGEEEEDGQGPSSHKTTAELDREYRRRQRVCLHHSLSCPPSPSHTSYDWVPTKLIQDYGQSS